MDNREALEQQLNDLEAQKVTLFDSGSVNQVEVDRLNEQIKEVQRKLSDIQTQEIADDFRTSDRPFVLTVGGVDINLRDYIPTEENYQLVAIALSQKLHEVETAKQAGETDLTNRFEIERQQYRDQITNADAAADAKYNELYEQFQAFKLEASSVKFERDELKSERYDMKNERDDFERRLQAATSEIESLKQQLEVANSKVETPKPNNIDGDLAEAMRKANEAKRAIYNVQKDTAGINYTARFVDTDEEFSDKVIYIGKFRVLSEEEAARFREEARQAQQDALESIPETAATAEPVNDFPLQAPELSDTLTAGGLVGDEAVSESDADTTSEPKTIEQILTEHRERLEWLEHEIDRIHGHITKIDGSGITAAVA